jgi:hypothetical protein
MLPKDFSLPMYSKYQFRLILLADLLTSVVEVGTEWLPSAMYLLRVMS